MRALRDRGDCVVCADLPNYPTTTQHSLEDVGKLWMEWGIHGLILVSFGLQVFLFFAAGLRRRSTSRILMSLLWLAYLSADSVAIFILGHLSVHASGPRHQLLFLWAPFVLLHLGGQQTITAFSMKDNELWRRHLLGLVTQVVVAGYVVTRPSWADKRLLAAMVLMFLSGCLRYGERSLCLYRASPTNLKESSLDVLRNYAKRDRDQEENDDGDDGDFISRLFSPDNRKLNYESYQVTIDRMLKADMMRPPSHESFEISTSAAALVSETPLSTLATTKSLPGDIQHSIQELKLNEDRCRAYNYVATRLTHIYELLYTKAPRHSILLEIVFGCASIGVFLLKNIPIRCPTYCIPFCTVFIILCIPFVALYYLFFVLLFFLLVLFPILSTSATLVLFMVAKKSQLYSQADVIVSYILLIGAVNLEVASLFITFALSREAPRRIRSAIWTFAKYIYPAWGTKQWSEMLGQYNMINSVTKQHATYIRSFVSQWIGKHLGDETIAHIPIYDDLKKFVLDKLLEFGTKPEDWNFASFRGQLALRDLKSRHGIFSFLLPARSETHLHKSINDVDFPTTVLIWHIATDILYFKDTNNIDSCEQMKTMSRELSNYIMYLVFKCGVTLTNTTQLQHDNALRVMEVNRDLGEKGAMKKVFQANQHQKWTSETPIPPLLPRACQVAQELIDISGEAKRWDLIAAVWLEMLYYVAPRCGGAFHSEHLATGGEFITHVLLLMQHLGPFVKP
ncbi:hypothetical protein VPH35_115776 [Triticum aestivum]|nr:uncharacterized protein LOC123142461 [Triticum aestivum]